LSSLYLHIPFCRSKCPYCDFYSQVADESQLDDYIDLLDAELQLQAGRRPATEPLETIFFGGGTPSLLSERQVAQLLNRANQQFGLARDCEISLEANPGTLTGDTLKEYRSAGINRISLGVQALDNTQLEQLGRGHTVEETRAAIAMIRQAGFDNLNLDLMFARPNLKTCDLESELTTLLSYGPEHVSLYGLSYEEGTEFFSRLQRGKLREADEALYREQYLLLHHKLTQAGFEHYEISNFARPDRRCRHNMSYWQRRTCLAAGCGAHSFEQRDWGIRRAVPADLDRYRRCLKNHRSPAETLETFTRQQAMAETVYLALRTADGLNYERFYQQFNQHPQQVFAAQIDRLAPHLLIHTDRWTFSIDSWLIYDHLISHFL